MEIEGLLNMLQHTILKQCIIEWAKLYFLFDF